MKKPKPSRIRTEEERLALSAKRSAAGRKGGRVAGYGKGRAPTKTLTVRKPDYDVIVALSDMRKVAIAEAIHILCTESTET